MTYELDQGTARRLLAREDGRSHLGCGLVASGSFLGQAAEGLLPRVTCRGCRLGLYIVKPLTVLVRPDLPPRHFRPERQRLRVVPDQAFSA